MTLTEQDKRDVLKEVFDANRVTLWCKEHNYLGPIKDRPEVTPHFGCPNCWKIFYIHELATTPPDKRAEKLAEIEEVMHKVVELVERGEWDVNIFPHAKIEIGRE